MAGFLFGGALLGLAAIAWPLYLHFRRRRQQVQIVPSLRLFVRVQKLNRRLQMQQLLLLIARLAMLVALVLIISQPFVRTRRSLPLPFAEGMRQPPAQVGILIDDSLSALHGTVHGSRLDLSRAWLTRQIESFPATTHFRLISTTCPFPSMPMSRQEALRALDTYRILPRRGEAALALQRLAADLGGELGCILVAAPRSLQLWQDLTPDTDLQQPLPVHFLDTSSHRHEIYIDQVTHDNANLVQVRLQGNPDRMAGRELMLLWQQTQSRSYTLTPHDALRGWAQLALPESPPDTVFELAVVDEVDHPWHRFWFRIARQGRSLDSAIIVRQPDPPGITADNLITAILQAGFPAMPIQHVDAGATMARQLPPAPVIICIGDEAPSSVGRWLQDRYDQGATILCFPSAGDSAHGPPKLPWYPHWRPVEELQAANARPLQVIEPRRLPVPGLDELILSGLADMPVNLYAPVDEGRQQSDIVLATRDGRPLVRVEQTEGSGKLVLIQVPLNLRDGSPMFHPLFPLLVARLLHSAAQASQESLEALVGESVSVGIWFERNRIDGELMTPQGERLDVRVEHGEQRFLPIDAAGIYRLVEDGTTSSRPANYPRESDPRLASREEWARARPNTRVVWYDPMALVNGQAVVRLGDRDHQAEARTYDLGPLAGLVLLIALALEAVMLWRIWQGRRQP